MASRSHFQRWGLIIVPLLALLTACSAGSDRQDKMNRHVASATSTSHATANPSPSPTSMVVQYLLSQGYRQYTPSQRFDVQDPDVSANQSWTQWTKGGYDVHLQGFKISVISDAGYHQGKAYNWCVMTSIGHQPYDSIIKQGDSAVLSASAVWPNFTNRENNDAWGMVATPDSKVTLPCHHTE